MSVVILQHTALTGIGLHLNASRNVIIRNLRISGVTAPQGDAIAIENARGIWVDHCDLSSDPSEAGDGYSLISVTHGSDSVTLTNNVFHDHVAEAVRVGHADDNAQQDAGKLHVSMVRNYFRGVKSAMSIRFGTGHVLNSYFANVSSAIDTRMSADVLVESSVFEGTGQAIRSSGGTTSEMGFATVKDSSLGGGSNTATAGTMTADSLPYPYDWYIWETDTVKERVVKQTGPILKFVAVE